MDSVRDKSVKGKSKKIRNKKTDAAVSNAITIDPKYAKWALLSVLLITLLAYSPSFFAGFVALCLPNGGLSFGVKPGFGCAGACVCAVYFFLRAADLLSLLTMFESATFSINTDNSASLRYRHLPRGSLSSRMFMMRTRCKPTTA